MVFIFCSWGASETSAENEVTLKASRQSIEASAKVGELRLDERYDRKTWRPARKQETRNVDLSEEILGCPSQIDSKTSCRWVGLNSYMMLFSLTYGRFNGVHQVYDHVPGMPFCCSVQCFVHSLIHAIIYFTIVHMQRFNWWFIYVVPLSHSVVLFLVSRSWNAMGTFAHNATRQMPISHWKWEINCLFVLCFCSLQALVERIKNWNVYSHCLWDTITSRPNLQTCDLGEVWPLQEHYKNKTIIMCIMVYHGVFLNVWKCSIQCKCVGCLQCLEYTMGFVLDYFHYQLT